MAYECAARTLINIVCELLAQGSLADTGLAGHDDQRGMSRRGGGESRAQLA